MNGRGQTPTWKWAGRQTLPSRIFLRLAAAIAPRVLVFTKHKSGLILAAIAIASICGVSWSAFLTLRNQRYLEQARHAVNETFTIKLLVNDALGLVSDIESGGRGFALTGDALFLEPLARAESKLQSVLVELSATVSAEQLQAGRVELISRLAFQRLNHAYALMELIREGAEASEVNEHAVGGKILTDRVRELAAAVWATEATQLTTRSTLLGDAMAAARYFTWWLVGAQFVLLIALGLVALRWRRAQALVKVCAWSRTIEYEGQWMTFEEYLHRRFGLLTSHGINPEEAEKFMAQVNRS